MHLRASKLTPLVCNVIINRASLQEHPTQFCAFVTIAVDITFTLANSPSLPKIMNFFVNLAALLLVIEVSIINLLLQS